MKRVTKNTERDRREPIYGLAVTSSNYAAQSATIQRLNELRRLKKRTAAANSANGKLRPDRPGYGVSDAQKGLRRGRATATQRLRGPRRRVPRRLESSHETSAVRSKKRKTRFSRGRSEAGRNLDFPGTGIRGGADKTIGPATYASDETCRADQLGNNDGGVRGTRGAVPADEVAAPDAFWRAAVDGMDEPNHTGDKITCASYVRCKKCVANAIMRRYWNSSQLTSEGWRKKHRVTALEKWRRHVEPIR